MQDIRGIEMCSYESASIDCNWLIKAETSLADAREEGPFKVIREQGI